MDEAQPRKLLEFVLILFLGVSLFTFCYNAAKVPFEERFIDFGGNLVYSLYLQSHPVSLYDWEGIERFRATLTFPYSHIRALYPLPMYLALTPFTLLDYRVMSLLWFGVNILFYAAALVLIIRGTGWRTSKLKIIVAVIIAAQLNPFIFNLIMGQTEGVVVFLLAASFYLAQRKRDWLAGIAIGAAVCIKVMPAFLIIFYLWKRKGRVVLSALATILAAHAVSVAVYGIALHREWLIFLLTRARTALFPDPENLSFDALFRRLLTANKLTLPVRHLPFLADCLAGAVSLLFGFLFFWRTRPKADPGGKRFALDYALAIATIPLVSVVVEQHHFTWLLISILIAAEYLLSSGTPFSVTLFVISFVLMGMGYYPDGLAFFRQGIATVFLNTKLYGVIGLWVLLFRQGDRTGQQKG